MRQNSKTFRVEKSKAESVNLVQEISEIASTIKRLRALYTGYAKKEIGREEFLSILDEYIVELETDCAYYERKLEWLTDASKI